MDGKLEAGIEASFNYYSTLNRDRYLDIENAQYRFLNRHILAILKSWYGYFKSSINSDIDTLILLLVFYIVITLIGFLLILFIYSSKINRRLNETIQMLNMIPLNMLPKNRKDIRDFFFWIIK